MNQSRLVLLITTIFSLFIFLAPSVLAAKPENTGVGNGNSKKPIAIVTTAKMKSCQARESAIKTRMTQLTKLVTTMMSVFDKIADRVKKYYTDKVLPSGKVLANYDILVNNIAASKTSVQTALDKAKADASAFVCTSDNPKGFLVQFNTNMKLVKVALKAYRTSINQLIVAVKTIPPVSPTPVN